MMNPVSEYRVAVAATKVILDRYNRTHDSADLRKVLMLKARRKALLAAMDKERTA